MTALSVPTPPVGTTSATSSAPRLFRLAVRQYHDLHARGFFHDRHVSLIDGLVYEEPQMNPPHAMCIRKGTRALESVFQVGFDVRVQLPLVLGLMSDPHPDLAVVVGSYMDFATRHPTAAALIVEISDSTLKFDQTDKASLYAAAGIADYWIADLNNRRVEVRRRPIVDHSQPFGSSYADTSTHAPGDAITPLAAPNSSLHVSDFLP